MFIPPKHGNTIGFDPSPNIIYDWVYHRARFRWQNSWLNSSLQVIKNPWLDTDFHPRFQRGLWPTFNDNIQRSRSSAKSRTPAGLVSMTRAKRRLGQSPEGVSDNVKYIYIYTYVYIYIYVYRITYIYIYRITYMYIYIYVNLLCGIVRLSSWVGWTVNMWNYTILSQPVP